MNKVLLILGLSFSTLILATACTPSSDGVSVTNQSIHQSTSLTGDNQDNKNAIYVGHTKSSDVMRAIKVAGEKTGWRTTEFKSDSILVEKDGMSSTIKFHNGHISGDNENAPMSELKNLRTAIVNELKSNSSHH